VASQQNQDAMSTQRPVMDPLFVQPFEPQPKKKLAARKWLMAPIKWFFRLLFSRPLALERKGEVPPRRGFFEFVRAIVCQLFFLPLALAGTAFLLMYVGTHPTVPAITADPNSVGIYFDTVSLSSTDGVSLTAWMAPSLDAHKIIDQKDLALRTDSPGIVLVHDFASSPQEFLPLIPMLHDEGYAVMAVGLRGVGAGIPRGQTFGANEAGDVRAAVEWLRQQPRVDGNRIFVVGLGSGATAALLAASRDENIKGLILADPVQTADEMLDRHVGPKDRRFHWLQPVCKWEYELYYHVEADDVNFSRMAQVTASRPSLILPGGSNQSDYFNSKTQRRIRDFLRQQFHTMDGATAKAVQ